MITTVEVNMIAMQMSPYFLSTLLQENNAETI